MMTASARKTESQDSINSRVESHDLLALLTKPAMQVHQIRTMQEIPCFLHLRKNNNDSILVICREHSGSYEYNQLKSLKLHCLKVLHIIRHPA